MKVTLRLLFASLVCCSLLANANADDRYRTGIPTTAPAKATLSVKPIGPTYQTAADPRPSAATSTRTELAPRTDLKPRFDGTPVVGAPAAATPTPTHVPLSLSSLNPTPEMWFYEQQRQDYNNPTLQVRRNAERAAAERRARLNAQAWYGVSNSRPTAYTTPHMYHYSPSWVGGNRYPYNWRAQAPVNVTIEARRNYAGVATW